MCVAKKVNEVLHLDEKEFLLGSIAPDATKYLGETKEKSHFLKDDIPQLEKFLDKYCSALKDNAYNLGYYCHLYTDYYWFTSFITRYDIYEDNHIKSYAEVYEDYDSLNMPLIAKYDLDISILDEEIHQLKTDIKEISIEGLNALTKATVCILNKSEIKELNVINREEVFEFIDNISNDFINNLKELGVIDE